MKFKVGDKVKIIGKSAVGSLEYSAVYSRMNNMKQEYAYVVGFERGQYICSEKMNESGDYFLEQDLVLYEDNYQGELSEIKDMMYSLQSRLEQLGKMCHDEFNEPNNETLTYEDYKKLVREAKDFVSDNLDNVKVIGGYFTTIDFRTNNDKETVVALAKVAGYGDVVGRGIAKCIKGDLFQEDIGKAIAIGKLLGKDVSKFTNI